MLVTAVSLLLLTLAAGGLVLSVADDVSYIEGVWLAFSVVSTTGFGEGPASALGMLVAMGLFAVATVGYLLLLIWAMTIGLERHHRRHLQGSVVAERDINRVLRNIGAN